MKYTWGGGYPGDPTKIKQGIFDCCLYLHEGKIFWAVKEEGILSGYTILTVDEFFRWSAEKERWPKRICVEGVQQTINVAAHANGHVHLVEAEDEDIMIFLTWGNLDQIMALRPREVDL